ncbi:MAG TPA: TrkA family potassium uptake protein [Desulfuromonadales bacterium]|nr:TrkA family potassium uptake protein [Desulfuromonadales bacterium]
MRIVLVGAGDLTVETAALLIDRGHEVVIIEEDKDEIDELSDLLDCSFLHGDGSKPHILDEAGPKEADFLFCLTQNDQYNIIAALVGRSLGYSQVVLRIQEMDYLNICQELDLRNTITPWKTIGRYLADMVAGIDILELSSFIKGEARAMMIKIDKETRGKVEDLDLPEEARVICYYRDEEFHLVDSDTTLKADDEAIILTHSKNLADLTERFHTGTAESNQDEEKED